MYENNLIQKSYIVYTTLYELECYLALPFTIPRNCWGVGGLRYSLRDKADQKDVASFRVLYNV